MATSVGLILRSKKTKDNYNEYGIDPNIKEIPGDEVCVLYLGGNGSRSNRIANGYLKPLELQVTDVFKQDIPLYAVKYDFDKEGDMGTDALNKFIRQGDNQSIYKHYNERKRHIYLNRHNIKHQINSNLDAFFKDGKLLPLDALQFDYVKIYIDSEDKSRKISGKLSRALKKIGYEEPVNDEDKYIRRKFASELLLALQKIGYDEFTAKLITSKLMLSCLGNYIEQLRYIDDAFKKIMLPRISKDGKRLPLEEAMKRIRKLNIVAHCHGGFVAQQIEAKTYDKMLELGYSVSEVKQILSQLLIVAHAPAYRPDKINSHFLAFKTAFDTFKDITPDNWLRRIVDFRVQKDIKHLMKNSLSTMEHEWLKNGPIFLGEKGGNLFLVAQGFEFGDDGDGGVGANSQEHNNTRYYRILGQTDEGYMLNLIARNVIRNGIANSLAQTDDKFIPLPINADLIKWNDKESRSIRPFKDMERDGEEFMKVVYEIARENKDVYHKNAFQMGIEK